MLKRIFFSVMMPAMLININTMPAYAAPVKLVMDVKSGTGFYIAPHYVVTNQHVASGCQRVMLRGEGVPTTTAKVIALDAHKDLALLKTEAKAPNNAYLRSNAGIRNGDNLNVIGYPEGYSANRGSLHTQAKVMNSQFRFNGIEGVQFTNAVNHGNSGGPLLDSDGNVIGVIVGKMSHYKSGWSNASASPYKEYGVAIGLPVLRNFLAQQGVVTEDRASYGTTTSSKASQYTVNIQCILRTREIVSN